MPQFSSVWRENGENGAKLPNQPDIFCQGIIVEGSQLRQKFPEVDLLKFGLKHLRFDTVYLQHTIDEVVQFFRLSRYRLQSLFLNGSDLAEHSLGEHTAVTCITV